MLRYWGSDNNEHAAETHSYVKFATCDANVRVAKQGRMSWFQRVFTVAVW